MKKDLYTTVFSQTFSEDGSHLAAADSHGNVAVYHVRRVLELAGCDDSVRECGRPEHRFCTGTAPVYSLLCDQRHLLCGTSGLVQAYRWSDILKRDYKMAWSIPIETDRESLSAPEVNDLRLQDGRLYVASGSRHVHVFDLETRQQVGALRGHTDYVHALSVRGDQCVSAGEDGAVRLWDTRQLKETHCLEPFREPELERGAGKWIGALDTTDEWLACGGGPRLGIWHMRSLTRAAVCELSCVAHVARFHDGELLAGGDAPDVRRFRLDGAEAGRIATGCSAVFTILARSQPSQLLTVGGCGKLIEVSTSNQFKEFSLSVL